MLALPLFHSPLNVHHIAMRSVNAGKGKNGSKAERTWDWVVYLDCKVGRLPPEPEALTSSKDLSSNSGFIKFGDMNL